MNRFCAYPARDSSREPQSTMVSGTVKLACMVGTLMAQTPVPPNRASLLERTTSQNNFVLECLCVPFLLSLFPDKLRRLKRRNLLRIRDFIENCRILERSEMPELLPP